MVEVVTMGEAMVLLVAEPGIPLLHADRYRRQVAGAESNVAVGLARLGHQVAWVGRVGGDSFGQVVLRSLRAEGVDVSAVTVDPEAPTGVLIRDSHPDRPIDVVYHRKDSAGSRLAPTDIDDNLIAAARIVHISGINALLSDSARRAVQAAAVSAREHGVMVCFDPNVRLRLASAERHAELLLPLIECADLVVTGSDEASLLSGRSERDAAAAWFLKRGAQLVVIRSGAAGAWATDGATTWQVPAHAARVTDPVGAGDAFCAGFLSATLRGLGVEPRLREAVVVSALSVQSAGDVPGLPSAAERDAVLSGADAVQR